jgi:3-isopropylmalate/(R)-2-methylmalate dehydratase large subunit
MAVEGGAKVGIFVPDETILAYAKTRGKRPFEAIYPDEGAPYAQRIEIDVAALEPLVAAPSSPGNMRRAAELSNTRVDQVFLGSCTNGRLRTWSSRRSCSRDGASPTRCGASSYPASYEVFAECMKRGYLDIFIEAGAP